MTLTEQLQAPGEKATGPRRLSWFSSGAASAVATMMDLQAHGGGEIVTCDTGSEDDDNNRFRTDCERWFRREVTVIGSEKYASTWDVWEKRGYMAGINGAVCTGELKFVPRLNFELPSDIHVFGYTADAPDIARANRLRATYPNMNVAFPLIERGIDKASCLALLKAVGIEPPRTYAMGFKNANCLKSGCCKATSPDYWSLHRKCYPEGFERTAALARKLNVRLARIKGERVFIDDIPEDWPTLEATAPECDLLCAIHQEDLAHAALTPTKGQSEHE